MRAGAFDRRITIVKNGEVDGDYGPQPGGPDILVAARIPAQVLDNLPSQSESVDGGLRMANRPARVRMRYRQGITSDMRVIVHGETDRMYEISGGPAEIGRREMIELTIREYSS